jgi:hypothetical protein
MLPALAVAVWLTTSVSPPPSVELRWHAPAGCPTQDALERQIAALRTDRPAPVQPPRVAFHVEQRGDRWHLVGEISGTVNSGRRELDAATCAELADAAVLIIAIAIDPDGADAPADVVPTPIADDGVLVPPPTAAPASPPRPAAPAPSEPTPDRHEQPRDGQPVAPAPIQPASDPLRAPPEQPRRPSALLGLAAGLGLGTLSSPTGLLRLALGLRGDRWSLALTQDFWLPRTVAAPQAPELGGRFWLWATGLRGCAILRARRIEAPLCATVAAGVMFGQGKGALNPALNRRSPWVAVAVGPGLRVPLGRRVGLLFSAELLTILARPRFEITDRGVVCCGAPVGGQFTGGVELRLP